MAYGSGYVTTGTSQRAPQRGSPIHSVAVSIPRSEGWRTHLPVTSIGAFRHRPMPLMMRERLHEAAQQQARPRGASELIESAVSSWRGGGGSAEQARATQQRAARRRMRQSLELSALNLPAMVSHPCLGERTFQYRFIFIASQFVWLARRALGSLVQSHASSSGRAAPAPRHRTSLPARPPQAGQTLHP
eukprot:SAG11_NODE_2214_length_3680_cov_33.077632_1_plen_189_part_00